MSSLLLLLLTLSFAVPDQGGESAGGREVIEESGYSLSACFALNGSIDPTDGGDTDAPTPLSSTIRGVTSYAAFRLYHQAPRQVRLGTSIIRAPPKLS